MPAESRKRWTAQEARELNEANPNHWPRYEVIDGELLVSPGPRPVHQFAIDELIVRLSPYVKAQALGRTAMAPADIELEPDSIVQPDLFVIPRAIGRQVRSWSEVSALLLAVEVLSPSTARTDRVKKRQYFLRNGVPEYWIVDCDARVIERWRPNDERPEIITERLVWLPAPATTPFELELAEYFAEVFGEDQETQAK